MASLGNYQIKKLPKILILCDKLLIRRPYNTQLHALVSEAQFCECIIESVDSISRDGTDTSYI